MSAEQRSIEATRKAARQRAHLLPDYIRETAIRSAVFRLYDGPDSSKHPTRRQALMNSRSSTFSSNNDSQSAALRGATKAFGQIPQKSSVANNAVNPRNSAIAAATTAGRGNKASSPVNWTRSQVSPSASADGRGYHVKGDDVKGAMELSVGNISNLGVPAQGQRGHVNSPSLAAASLAQARAPSPSPSINPGLTRSRTAAVRKPAVAPKPRVLSSAQADPLKRSNTDRTPDSTSIPPTTSLVDLFERRNNVSRSSTARPGPIIIKPSNDLALKSPKPVRTSGGLSSVFRVELEGSSSPARAADDERIENAAITKHKHLSRSPDDDYASASESFTESISPPNNTKCDVAPTKERLALSPATQMQDYNDRRPLPLHRTTTAPVRIENRPARALNPPPEQFSPSSSSMKSIPAQWNQLHPRAMTPNMTGDQLANAMVASSLASSRAPSPRKQEPPPPPTRRQKHHTVSLSRTPSPTKSSGMRHTLRKAESESSEAEDENTLHPYGKHKKKRHMARHPNKHHEGDRKRWRDAVTERERKRYEGVWAANKGLLCSYTPEEHATFSHEPESARVRAVKDAISDSVSNIVVRDVWSRSRLSEDVLETIWDLVDGQFVGRLSKEEFVVGTWLIDQRLKGRKLPVKVSDTVWASVRGIQGIKIKKSL